MEVVFVKDHHGRNLYARIGLMRKVGDTYAEYGEVGQNSGPDSPAIDIVTKFKSEQFPTTQKSVGTLYKIPETLNDPVLKYLSGNCAAKSLDDQDQTLNDRDLALSIDILYPTEDSFIQLSSFSSLMDIELVGLLADLPLGTKSEWLIALVTKSLIDMKYYECLLVKTNGEIGFSTTQDFEFVIKLKHDGIYKRVLKIPVVSKPNVDINEHLLQDLNRLHQCKVDQLEWRVNWQQEKELLVKTILKFSELVSLNELSTIIKGQNSALIDSLGLDLVQFKQKSQPLSKLDLIKRKADETFNIKIPGHYVPIIQGQFDEIKELRKIIEDAGLGHLHPQKHSLELELDDGSEQQQSAPKRQKTNNDKPNESAINEMMSSPKTEVLQDNPKKNDDSGYETELSEDDEVLCELDVSELRNLSEETQLSEDENEDK